MLTRNRPRRKKYVHYVIITACWAILIFILSSQTHNSQNLQPWLQRHLPIQSIEKHFASFEFYYGREQISMKASGAAGLIEFLIRKMAHVVEYMILGVLILQLLFRGLRFRLSLSILLTFSVCVLYASSDEIHQFFTEGRNPKMADVYLDTIGACLGMGLIILFSWMRSRKRGKAIE